MANGVFIVIDGTDGSGKGTQTKILVDRLRKENYDVEIADFPRYENLSSHMVKKYLNGDYGSANEVGPYRASILFACDRYDASFKIKQWLEEGKVVISNRYVSSNMGHQTGKITGLEKREKFLDWLDNLEYNLFEIPRPDINILLYVPPEMGQRLVDEKGHRDYVGGSKRDIHEADLEHLKSAAEAYLYVAKKYNWLVVDSAPNGKLKTIEAISEDIWDLVKSQLRSK
ncbi:MAG: thymidylate kinase [Nanoarchaeota archaeon]|nr:thymidylate kinase [Nanoarchaeota archaeon]